MMNARPLPPKYKHIFESQWLRRFTWKERFWIFLGCPVRLDLTALTEHSPGKIKPDLRVQLAPTQSTPTKGTP